MHFATTEESSIGSLDKPKNALNPGEDPPEPDGPSSDSEPDNAGKKKKVQYKFIFNPRYYATHIT